MLNQRGLDLSHVCDCTLHYRTSSRCCHRAKLIAWRQGRERSGEQSLSKIMSCSGGFSSCFCGVISLLINIALYESSCEAVFHRKP